MKKLKIDHAYASDPETFCTVCEKPYKYEISFVDHDIPDDWAIGWSIGNRYAPVGLFVHFDPDTRTYSTCSMVMS